MIKKNVFFKLSRYNYRFLIIWCISGLFYLYEFIHRIIPSVIVSELIDELSIDAYTLGNFSSYYYFSYAFMQIPAGYIIDKYNIHFVLPFSALLIAINSYIFSVTNSLEIIIITRILIGIGSAFSFISCLKLGISLFHENKFAFVVGITNLLGVCGAILSGRPLVYFIELFGWRQVMLIISIIGLLFFIILIIFLRPLYLIKIFNFKISHFYILKNIYFIFKNIKILKFSIYGGLIVSPIASYSELWGISFLVDNYNISKSLAAQMMSFSFIGIGLGGPIIGYLADFYKKKILFMIIGNIGAIFFFIMIINIISNNILILHLFHVFFGFFSSSMLLCFSINVNIIKSDLKAVILGFTNMLIMIIAVLLQPIVGKIIDILTNTSLLFVICFFNILDNYQIAMIPLIICQILALLIIIKIKKQYIFVRK
ncbi:MAG: MFS transporter [Candidatus Azosocius agrarius]|nr:MAG: MFS transporter [Gammaproteobacteria bacterium]